MSRFSLLLLSLTLTGCVTTKAPGWLPGSFSSEQPLLSQIDTKKAATILNEIDDNTERKLMQSSGLGLVEHDALENFLNAQLALVKQAAGLPQAPGNVYVLASPGMNARATADGNIYIPVGMLLDIDSTDELTALLAHEFAHTVFSHTDTDILLEIQKKGTAVWALANTLTADNPQSEQTRRRIRNALALSLASEKVINPTWNRKQELDADKLAADLLIATGRNPDGIIVLLGRLSRWDEINQKLLAQHKNRSSALLQAAKSQLAQNELQATLMDAFNPVALKTEDAISGLGETHLSPESRLEEIRSYLRQHHRRASRPAFETKEWKRIGHGTRTRQIAAGVRHSYESYEQATEGNITAARRTLQRANTSASRNQIYYKTVQAIIAHEQGRTTEVARITISAMNARYPSFRLRLMHEASEPFNPSQPSTTRLQALQTEFDNFGRPPEFYPDLIKLAEQANNIPAKYELVLRCHLVYLENTAPCASTQTPPPDSAKPGLVDGLMGLFGS